LAKLKVALASQKPDWYEFECGISR
jgi:hypothetical protein